MSIAKSNLNFVENTLSKPQETLEFKMTKQKIFSFDVPVELPEHWMTGVTNLEVYNTVYNITEKNKKFIIPKDDQLKSSNIDSQLVINVEYLYKTTGDIETLINFLLIVFLKIRNLLEKILTI